MLATHSVVERFTVLRVLGAGAMATVYLVRHNQLGSLHALKVLREPSGRLLRRLLREGRSQGALRHPNVVSVNDIVSVQGQPGLVMEFVEGPTLREWMGTRPLPLEQVDDLARGILAGVAAVHRQGMVHRDLKPGNVLLQIAHDRLMPRVTDFGLVKVLADAEGDGPRTRTGAILGTPAYMAPEQLRAAGAVDARADVFSVGVLLHRLVTGRLARTDGGAPVVELGPEVPSRMVGTIAAALQVEAAARPADCGELLDRWCAGSSEPVGVWDPETLARARATLDVEQTGGAGQVRDAGQIGTVGEQSTDTVDVSVSDQVHSIGGYPLRGVLGRGGMGVVYHVWDPDLQRDIALKMLNVGAPGGIAYARFVREARAVAALDHPAIIRILSLDLEADPPFFTMPLIAGPSLSKLLSEGPLPVEFALEIAEAVARGLHHAHTAGLVHRDIKPSNILMEDGVHPRIVDFGIATGAVDQPTLTSEEQILGTPAYMPPEQAAGRWGDVGPGSDIYALGAVLYHMLSGEPPYRGSVMEIVVGVLSRAPPRLRFTAPGLSSNVARVCERAMARMIADRYPSALALAEDLRACRVGTAPSRRPWRLPRAMIPGAVVVGAVSAALAFLPQPELPPSRVSVHVLSGVELDAPPPVCSLLTAGALSGGREICYTAADLAADECVRFPSGAPTLHNGRLAFGPGLHQTSLVRIPIATEGMFDAGLVVDARLTRRRVNWDDDLLAVVSLGGAVGVGVAAQDNFDGVLIGYQVAFDGPGYSYLGEEPLSHPFGAGGALPPPGGETIYDFAVELGPESTRVWGSWGPMSGDQELLNAQPPRGPVALEILAEDDMESYEIGEVCLTVAPGHPLHRTL